MVDRLFSEARLAELYDLLAPWGEPDDRFYLPLVMAADSVLDVGCGTGQLLREARSAGHGGRLCGLDPANAMLDVARVRSDIEWILGDLTTVSFDREFDLIVMTGHAFQVFITDDQLRVALAAIRAALTDSGRFAFETRNPLARRWERWTADYPMDVVTAAGDAVRYTNEVELPVEGDLVSFTSRFTSPSWDEPQLSHSTLRFLDAAALAAFLTEAGLVVDERFGDWDRSPLTTTSPEIITIARGG
jgi:SAM-dependent methyltransferase